MIITRVRTPALVGVFSLEQPTEGVVAKVWLA